MDDFLEKSLEQKLKLYQRFVKLYESHGELLDSILQLESIHLNSTDDFRDFGSNHYFIEGVVEESSAYLATNLVNGRTKKFIQPQQAWLLGRDRYSGIFVPSLYASRYHAIIEYDRLKSRFYFTDLGSTNGSFINEESIYQTTELKDGDRIRVGTLIFSFFARASTQILPEIDLDILKHFDEQESRIPAFNVGCFSRTKTKPIYEDYESTVHFSQELKSPYEDTSSVIASLASSEDETSKSFDCLLRGDFS